MKTRPARLDHVAFLVSDIDESMRRLAHLELPFGEPQTFEAEGTREVYAGRLLFMQPVGEGPYATAFAKRGAGLHHIAIHVDDLGSYMRSIEVSGWLMHPKSYATSRAHQTVWLARPGVEALIEVQESDSVRVGALDHIEVKGLDVRPDLASIFEGMDVKVGDRSGVWVNGEFIG